MVDDLLVIECVRYGKFLDIVVDHPWCSDHAVQSYWIQR